MFGRRRRWFFLACNELKAVAFSELVAYQTKGGGGRWLVSGAVPDNNTIRQ